MRTVALTKESTKDILENLLKRSPNNYGKFEAAVDNILKNVKEKGDEALFAYTKEFDKTEITGETIRVTEEEIKEYLAGNLCRCSGYEGQLRGILNFLEYKKNKNGGAE